MARSLDGQFVVYRDSWRGINASPLSDMETMTRAVLDQLDPISPDWLADAPAAAGDDATPRGTGRKAQHRETAIDRSCAPQASQRRPRLRALERQLAAMAGCGPTRQCLIRCASFSIASFCRGIRCGTIDTVTSGARKGDHGLDDRG